MAVRRVLAVLILGPICASTAWATPQVALRTQFAPDVLGASTTIIYGFQISETDGQLPPPLSDVDLHLPAGMGLASSSLGLATCTPARLQAGGPGDCPAEARLGFGHALVKVPTGEGTLQERGEVAAVLGPSSDEHLVVLFYVEGTTPVAAQLVFPGELLDDLPPFGTHVDT